MNIVEILKSLPQGVEEPVAEYITRIIQNHPSLKYESVRRTYYRYKDTKLVIVKQTHDKDGNLVSYVAKKQQDRMAEFDLPIKRVSTHVASGTQWVIQEASAQKTTVESINTLITAAIDSLNREPIKLNPAKSFNKRVVVDIITDVHAGMDPSHGFLSYEWNSAKLIQAFEQNLSTLLSYFNIHGRFEELVLMDLGDTLDGYEGLTTRGGHKLDQNMTSEQQFSLVLNSYISLIESILEYDITDAITIHRAENCNHCFTQDVEVLTDSGWKYYKELDNKDLVASKILSTNEIVFDKPIAYILNENVECDVHTYHNKNIDLSVTDEHRMLYKRERGPKTVRTYEYGTSNELFKKDKTNVHFQVSGSNLKPDYDISDDLIRLTAWIITDGSITKSKDGITPIGFVITQAKEPTKLRIRKLLNDLGIDHRESEINRERTHICGKELKKPHKVLTEFDKKELPKWLWELSKRQFDIFLAEVILGGGSVRVPTSATISGTKNILDQFQSLCVLNDTKANLLKDNRGDYLLIVVYNKTEISFKPKLQLTKEHYKGYTWCLTMPQSNLVVRRNGKVSIQGNSGSFNQILGTALEGMLKRLYPTAKIKFVRQADFIAYKTYGDNTIVTTHGKDKKYMKHGMPLVMNGKWEQYLNSIFKRWGVLGNDIKVFKGDLHTLGMSTHTFFDYYNFAAFSPPSGWCAHNIGDSKKIGFSIHSFGERKGSYDVTNHNFDWL